MAAGRLCKKKLVFFAIFYIFPAAKIGKTSGMAKMGELAQTPVKTALDER